jgi:hypothetical protein
VTTDAHRGALEAVERLLNRGGDADDVLRSIVDALHDRLPHLGGVWIEFVEGTERVVGPAAGMMRSDRARMFPVSFQGTDVAAVRVAAAQVGVDDETLLERVAILISPYCLVGWDTGGERWEP